MICSPVIATMSHGALVKANRTETLTRIQPSRRKSIWILKNMSFSALTAACGSYCGESTHAARCSPSPQLVNESFNPPGSKNVIFRTTFFVTPRLICSPVSATMSYGALVKADLTDFSRRFGISRRKSIWIVLK